jgi:hypothetical protein
MPITLGDTTVSSSANISLRLNAIEYANITSSGVVVTDDIALAAYSFNRGPLGGFRNKIINGKMEISQRGSSFTSPNTFNLDRWYYNANAGAATVSQLTDVPSSNEFQNSLAVLVNTADTSVAAGEYAAIIQPIEGYNIRDLIGKTFVVSFWVKSNRTGVYGVSLRNSGTDRSYVTILPIVTTNNWVKRAFTVIGGLPTDGTWNYNNGIGLYLTFTLMAGTTYQTLTLGSWQTGNFTAPTSQVNFMDTVNNDFRITGVQLEPGPAVTPFEHRPYGIEFRMCQRYYQEVGTSGQNEFIYYQYNPSTSTFYTPYSLPVPMRVAPTPTVAGTWNFANLTAQPNGFSVSASYNAFRINVQPSAAGNISLAQNSGSGSRITFNAELM